MTRRDVLLGVTIGLIFATLPFLRFTHFGVDAAAHTDHEPHHGGQLGMVGDHHIELVEHRGEIQVFVSDARRRPVQPARGWVKFDASATVPLTWQNHRLVGKREPSARLISVEVVLPEGTRAATTFAAQVAEVSA